MTYECNINFGHRISCCAFGVQRAKVLRVPIEENMGEIAHGIFIEFENTVDCCALWFISGDERILQLSQYDLLHFLKYAALERDIKYAYLLLC